MVENVHVRESWGQQLRECAHMSVSVSVQDCDWAGT